MVWGAPITPAILKNMSEEEAIKHVESEINAASRKAFEILANV
jgi:hypothetical protein